MLQLRFKLRREAEDQALATVSIWKEYDCRKYDKLVDSRNMHRERTHFAKKRFEGNNFEHNSRSTTINTAVESWDRKVIAGISVIVCEN